LTVRLARPCGKPNAAAGAYPPFDDAATYRYDPFDLTKVRERIRG